MEDDSFLADLSKQISLLITDEGEGGDDVILNPPPTPWHFRPLQDSYCAQRQQHGYVQDKTCHRRAREIVSKGTGVFIPRLPQPRRKRGADHDHDHHNMRNCSSVSNNHMMLQQQQQQEGDHGTTGPPQEDFKANHFH
ncbi:hypothetical protein MLD38_016299 [Melastoma candidum]|uniref:Uncharacterized protein n=1 Tax=Melastoma candidum TaxID=119954 RepID=A0ACB9RSG5_9MYRT|nr:hypothetical protein MLD38_016299 [Melastoma candidum]